MATATAQQREVDHGDCRDVQCLRSDHQCVPKEVWIEMRYNNRAEVERIGRAGSYYEEGKDGLKARVLSTFWLYLDRDDDAFTPHQTVNGHGFWEAWLTLWVSQNVKPGSRCIDIGANVGYYTLFLLDHGCRVRAVEPQPHLAELVERSVKENGFRLLTTGTVDRNAITHARGVATLIIPHRHGSGASVTHDIEGVSVAYEVDTFTLDDYCEGKPYYDFVKIDAEGAEGKLFRGAGNFIKENPDCVYLVEWTFGHGTEKELFELFDVAVVNYDGQEVPVPTADKLAAHRVTDWTTLALRKKK